MNPLLKKLVQEKKTELEKLLEEWIKKNNILLPNQELIVSIRIKKRQIFQNLLLTPDQWNKILKLPFQARWKPVIDFFHKNNNTPSTPAEIVASLSEQQQKLVLSRPNASRTNWHFNYDLFKRKTDRVFSSFDLPFRFRRIYLENRGHDNPSRFAIANIKETKDQ